MGAPTHLAGGAGNVPVELVKGADVPAGPVDRGVQGEGDRRRTVALRLAARHVAGRCGGGGVAGEHVERESFALDRGPDGQPGQPDGEPWNSSR
jgi:hypothetical protein